MDYAGDVTPEEAAAFTDADGVIVDVRTRAEWGYVGLPQVDNADRSLLLQEWQIFPAMSVDPDFAQKLHGALEQRGFGTETPIAFLCRSGVRSLAAARAMTAMGYAKCFNITGGFEGEIDADGHRGKVNGWKASGLPWRQS